LLQGIRQARDLGAPLEKLLPTCTLNPASLFRFKGRGHLAAGNIADVVVCSQELKVEATIAEGHFLVRNSEPVVRGFFEDR